VSVQKYSAYKTDGPQLPFKLAISLYGSDHIYNCFVLETGKVKGHCLQEFVTNRTKISNHLFLCITIITIPPL